ncbi:hypothetical protein [Kitasatospora viridis]|uniref:EVE domain-containing protein n=1 Tax=Kitasatospora viridis TaxID=281105 RepID=A0A561UBY6_9ACTN|nr:hypothetical protein [Kitasatospora viridis]TWF96870.1 hypothetical protein FHX73_11644 [Kitasatospora viridis]
MTITANTSYDPTSHILVVNAREPLLWILQEQRTAFTENPHRPHPLPKRGDELFLYATGTALGSRKEAGRLIGNATAVGDVINLADPVQFDGTAYSQGLDLRIHGVAPRAKGVIMAGLKDHLEIISNKVNWGPALRSATVALPRRDADLIRRDLQPLLESPESVIDQYRAGQEALELPVV